MKGGGFGGCSAKEPALMSTPRLCRGVSILPVSVWVCQEMSPGMMQHRQHLAIGLPDLGPEMPTGWDEAQAFVLDKMRTLECPSSQEQHRDGQVSLGFNILRQEGSKSLLQL